MRFGLLAVMAMAAMPAAAADYPDPECIKPQARLIDANPTDQNDVSSYNARVRRYNQQSRDYNACMHAYVDKANADIKTVQETANAEMARIRDTANSDMRQIEGKIRDAVAAVNTPPPEPPVDRSSRIRGGR